MFRIDTSDVSWFQTIPDNQKSRTSAPGIVTDCPSCRRDAGLRERERERERDEAYLSYSCLCFQRIVMCGHQLSEKLLPLSRLPFFSKTLWSLQGSSSSSVGGCGCGRFGLPIPLVVFFRLPAPSLQRERALALDALSLAPRFHHPY